LQPVLRQFQIPSAVLTSFCFLNNFLYHYALQVSILTGLASARSLFIQSSERSEQLNLSQLNNPLDIEPSNVIS